MPRMGLRTVEGPPADNQGRVGGCRFPTALPGYQLGVLRPSSGAPPSATHLRRLRMTVGMTVSLCRIPVFPGPLRLVQLFVGAADDIGGSRVGVLELGDAEGDRAANRPFLIR